MADVPREVFREILTVLSTSRFQDLPLTTRGAWLPVDVQEALAKGWVVADGADEGMFGRPIQITDAGRQALSTMPYPPRRR
jgi:hypothetical protein